MAQSCHQSIYKYIVQAYITKTTTKKETTTKQKEKKKMGENDGNT